jgi:hypothetical protein
MYEMEVTVMSDQNITSDLIVELPNKEQELLAGGWRGGWGGGWRGGWGRPWGWGWRGGWGWRRPWGWGGGWGWK